MRTTQEYVAEISIETGLSVEDRGPSRNWPGMTTLLVIGFAGGRKVWMEAPTAPEFMHKAPMVLAVEILLEDFRCASRCAVANETLAVTN